MERLPTANFRQRVIWLRLGDQQLHLFERERTVARRNDAPRLFRVLLCASSVTFGSPVSEYVATVRAQVDPTRIMRRLPLGITLAASLFALVWVLFWAPNTNFGPAIDHPDQFFLTLLNGIYFSAELFIVASGFALIFGLMRVVNMAHGSFY